MDALQKQTLLSIVEEFPTFSWDQDVLDELIDPKLGVITAFGEILDQIETLMGLDLGEIGLTDGSALQEGTDE